MKPWTLLDAGLTKGDITSTWFGLAGADRESDFKILRTIVGKIGLPQANISNDTTIAMRAGSSQAAGVVIICGTGVNCLGINAEGNELQIGGFGYPYGDFGGGGELSVEVFRRVIRAWDGREGPTLLTDLMLKQLQYSTMDELVADFLDHAKPIPQHLVKSLFTAAHQGDQAALKLLHQQGDELALSAVTVIQKLQMEQETFDIVLAGSVLTRGDSSGMLRRIIEQQTKQVAPLSTVRILNIEPVVGAILLAMEQGGRKLSSDLIELLKSEQFLGVTKR